MFKNNKKFKSAITTRELANYVLATKKVPTPIYKETAIENINKKINKYKVKKRILK